MPLQLAQAGAYLLEIFENLDRVGGLWTELRMADIKSYMATYLVE